VSDTTTWTENADADCKNCKKRIVLRNGRWWHRAGWFWLCQNGVTKAEPQGDAEQDG